MRHARSSRQERDEESVLHAGSERLAPADGLSPSTRGRQGRLFSKLTTPGFKIVGSGVHYTHIFGIADEAGLPSAEALDALSAAMKARPYRSGDSDIPAGYTYLGQFIFHDITAMTPGSSRFSPKNARTPSLDLDSVLPGLKPADSPDLCAADGLFKIGMTSEFPRPEDIPRDWRRPLIADPRNDDFLPLAQCHLLLLKFYNAAARRLGYDGGHRDESWWSDLRTLWVQHFQSIVLHDYLPRIIDAEIYRDVLASGRRLVRTEAKPRGEAWLPIEFAGAVGRFGHSMVRQFYKPWNKRLAWTVVTVEDFMNFSHANSTDGLEEGVPFLWSTNWRSLFDFGDAGFAGETGSPIKAARIDTQLAPELHTLPSRLRSDMCDRETRPGPSFNLAAATMKRGQELGLASAQQALKIANSRLGVSIPQVEADELFPRAGGLGDVAVDFPDLASATPLWYYVLREAEWFGGGRRLGPLGGRIVMETLHAAIEATEDSILAGEWKPTFPAAGKDKYSITDLILFSAHPNPVDPY